MTEHPTCKRCRTEVLRQSEFLQACRDAGLFVDSEGRVALRLGNLAGTEESVSRGLAEQQRNQQSAHDRLESRKGFQCYKCEALYCTDCLMDHAPPHPRGGKACPMCGATFGRFE